MSLCQHSPTNMVCALSRDGIANFQLAQRLDNYSNVQTADDNKDERIKDQSWLAQWTAVSRLCDEMARAPPTRTCLLRSRLSTPIFHKSVSAFFHKPKILAVVFFSQSSVALYWEKLQLTLARRSSAGAPIETVSPVKNKASRDMIVFAAGCSNCGRGSKR